MLTVYQKSYVLPDPDSREILRYAGMRGAADEVVSLLDECIAETESLLRPRVCWCCVGIKEVLEMPECAVIFDSLALSKHLEGCSRIVIFAATIGIETDRAITRYNVLSPTKALLISAIGSERIEALCDAFENDLRSEGRELRPRFSPGYSDLPLQYQGEIFSLLDCPRRIGLTLTDSMLMSPSKSVSAIIGIK